MKPSQWVVFGVGSVIAGVTTWHALYGQMPHDLGIVITGYLLAVGHFVWAFVGLDNTREGKHE